MSVDFASHDEICEAIKESVVIGLDFREGGARIFLKDGRTLLFPGADTVYICASKWLLN